MTLETSTTEYNLIEPTEIKNEVRVYIANILHLWVQKNGYLYSLFEKIQVSTHRQKFALTSAKY